MQWEDLGISRERLEPCRTTYLGCKDVGRHRDKEIALAGQSRIEESYLLVLEEECKSSFPEPGMHILLGTILYSI